MQAEGADEIVGKLALVDISAYLADVALFALGIWFGLYVAVVIGVRHGLGVGYNSRFGHLAEKKATNFCSD